MSLKKYDDLTGEQREKVRVMYSDQETVQHYLYNFDENGNYHGRQFTPETGVIHAESTVKEVVEKVKEEVKEVVKKVTPKKKKK